MREGRALLVIVVLVALLAAIVWVATGWQDDTVPVAPDEAPAAATPMRAAEPESEPARDLVAPEPELQEEARAPSLTDDREDLWGRVVARADGSPIAGADVFLLHREADEFWNLDLEYGQDELEVERTVSGADGGFRFTASKSRNYRVRAQAPGFAPCHAVGCASGSEIVVPIGRGGSVEGVVRDEESGDPLAGVGLVIVVRGVKVELGRGATAADGTFRFEHLPAERVFLQVRPEAHEGVWERIAIVDGQTHRLEIELARGQTIAGRVLDAVTRAPIAGAQVSDSWTFGHRVESDADGRFSLAGVGIGTHEELHVRAEGYAGASRPVTSVRGKDCEFLLARGSVVTGRFVGQDGAPAQGIYAALGVSYSDIQGMENTDWVRASVDSAGLFSARGLQPNRHYWLFARGVGYGTRTYALPRPLADGESFDLGDVVLLPQGRVEGRVVNDEGDPVAGTEVSLRGTNADADRWLAAPSPPERVTQFTTRSVDTDGRGRFRFSGVSAGTYRLMVRGAGRGASVSQEVELLDGQATEGVEIVLPIGEVLGGVVKRSDGQPVADLRPEIWLMAWGESGTESATVQPDGTFRFAGVEEGEYTVSMAHGPEGWALAPVPAVSTGTTDLVLMLSPSSFLRGKVIDAAGEPIVANVWATPDHGNAGSFIHSTELDGTFELEVHADFVGTVQASLAGKVPKFVKQPVVAGTDGIVLQLVQSNGR